MADRILRIRELESMVSLDAVTIWRHEKAGRFPARIKLGPRAVGWLQSEVEAWIRERTASGRSANSSNSDTAAGGEQ